MSACHTPARAAEKPFFVFVGRSSRTRIPATRVTDQHWYALRPTSAGGHGRYGSVAAALYTVRDEQVGQTGATPMGQTPTCVVEMQLSVAVV